MNICDIMSLIPHRYPFLLVDRIIEIKLNESAIGIKNVTANEPQFTGHFPSRPVMPGVLIVEALAQLSAVLVAKSMQDVSDKEVYFMSIDNTKFRSVVEPGDTLTMYSAIKQNRGNVWKFATHANIGDKLVAESSLTAMVRNKA
jgi:3-hydroxyacyl-[acyl-carrier-protein] dehydratase